MYKRFIHYAFKILIFQILIFFEVWSFYLARSKYWDRLRKYRGNCVHIRQFKFNWPILSNKNNILWTLVYFEILKSISLCWLFVNKGNSANLYQQLNPLSWDKGKWFWQTILSENFSPTYPLPFRYIKNANEVFNFRQF